MQQGKFYFQMKLPQVQDSTFRRSLSILGTFTLLCSGGMSPARSQITPDGTLSTTVTTPDNLNFTINDGNRAGNNLFHSFSEFSIPTGGTAFFNNALDIQNIFSRVTGGSISHIDGLIRANGTANLFLLNPSGIIFGPNASLNIGGSFFASTASKVLFADGVEFITAHPTATPLLTVSVPVGLQFNGNEGNIVVQSGIPVPIPTTNVTESADAGQLLDTAQAINSSGQLPTTISGNLPENNDVDLYQIHLTGGQPFQATTEGGSTVDTQLFLFDSQGLGLLANDDTSGSQFQSTLSRDEPLIPPADGTYYLGITSIGNNPVSANGLIFDSSSPNGEGAGLPLSGWNNNGGESGAYTIRINPFESLFIRSPLQVMPGRTLALVGGQVSLNGAVLRAPGGRVEIGGLSAPGTVRIENDGSLRFPSDATGTISLPRADVAIAQAAEVNVRAGGGGNIAIHARNLEISDNSRLLAGIEEKMGTPESQAGNIDLNATGTIIVTGGSAISNSVRKDGLGQGGDINILTEALVVNNKASLNTTTLSIGNAGRIDINARDSIVFDKGKARSDVGVPTLFPEQAINFQGKSGGIDIIADSLIVTNGSELTASTFGIGDAGDLNINLAGAITIAEDSFVASVVDKYATGDSGDINITARSLTMTTGGRLSAATTGLGNAGNVNINVRDRTALDGEGRTAFSSFTGIFTTISDTGEGKGGTINIATGWLSLTNGARLQAVSSGIGDSGDVNVKVRDMISLDGNSRNFFRDVADVASGIFTEARGTGNGGDIAIEAGSLSITNSANISAGTLAMGNAGNIKINVRDRILLDGAKEGLTSSIYSAVAFSAEGDGGDINITTGSLSVTNGAQLRTDVFGKGVAGTIAINARDGITFDGGTEEGPFSSVSGAYSTVAVDGTGAGGDINITAGSLSMTNGAQLSASTSNEGDAGNVFINTRDTVKLDGVGLENERSGIFSSVVDSFTVGKGGNIKIATGSLFVTHGAQLSASTAGKGDAGNVMIHARDRVSFDGQSLNGDFSEASTRVTSGARGDGGDISITTGELSVSNGAQLSASSLAEERQAGNLEVIAQRAIALDNQAELNADTKGGQGNIRLRSPNIQLTRNSQISTNATGGESGGNINIQSASLILRQNSLIGTNAEGDKVKGGNITLNSDVLAALENSDITANSDNFFGGRVFINTQGIFGTQFRSQLTPESDITATGGTPEQSGTVQINTPDVDPSSGLIQLPQNFVDATALVDRRCEQGDAASRFVVTGRGGLPASPDEPLASEAFWEDLRLPLQRGGEGDSAPMLSRQNTIVEAQGWVINSKGQVTLTADVPAATPQHSGLAATKCQKP